MLKLQKRVLSVFIVICCIMSAAAFAVSEDSSAEAENILAGISDSCAEAADGWYLMDMAAYGKKDALRQEDISRYLNSAVRLASETQKATDFSKAAIICTSLGLSPLQIPAAGGGTVSLIDKISSLADPGGINAAAFALLAYDSGGYEVTAMKNDRQGR